MVIADLALAFLAAYVTLDLAKRLERSRIWSSASPRPCRPTTSTPA
jgi:hypothetical protein